MNYPSEIKQEQKSMCEQYGLDFEKVEDICSKIIPLFQKTITELGLTPLGKEIVNGLKRGSDYLSEIVKIVSGKKLTPKQESIVTLLTYLAESEGVFSEVVQVIAFILIVNGHDIYDPQRMKFVKEYGDLDKVTLYIKLQFIEEHGFEYIAEIFDRELRNCIAHMQLIVKDDGIVQSITGKKIEKEELMKKLLRLSGISIILINIFRETRRTREPPFFGEKW